MQCIDVMHLFIAVWLLFHIGNETLMNRVSICALERSYYLFSIIQLKHSHISPRIKKTAANISIHIAEIFTIFGKDVQGDQLKMWAPMVYEQFILP